MIYYIFYPMGDIDSNIESRLKVNLYNIDNISQCIICMEDFNTDTHKPLSGDCNCNTMICEYCFKCVLKKITDDLGNVSHECPTCRTEKVNYIYINSKVVKILNELIKIKNSMEEYVSLHSNCKTTHQLIDELIKVSPKSDVERYSMDELFKLIITLTNKATNYEQDVKMKNLKTSRLLADKENILKEWEERLIKTNENNKKHEAELKKRTQENLKIEVERENFNKKTNELNEQIQTYDDMITSTTEQVELLNQNQKLFEVRERELTVSEKTLNEKQDTYEYMQQILETEMKQLFKDKEDFELSKSVEKQNSIHNNKLKIHKNESDELLKQINQLKQRAITINTRNKLLKEDGIDEDDEQFNKINKLLTDTTDKYNNYHQELYEADVIVNNRQTELEVKNQIIDKINKLPDKKSSYYKDHLYNITEFIKNAKFTSLDIKINKTENDVKNKEKMIVPYVNNKPKSSYTTTTFDKHENPYNNIGNYLLGIHGFGLNY